MGSYIKAAVAERGRGGPFAPGALELTDTAARVCLVNAGHRAEEVDLLVNAGLFKNDNMAEPALASIIQEDIGANPGHPPRRGRHGTFSFDVMNGGCGVLSALQVVDAFVGPGTARLGLVVAGDADPAPGVSHGFVFPPVGGALLLSHIDDGRGFRGFALETFPEHQGLFEARVSFERPRPLRRGRSVLDVREDPRYAAVCTEKAIEVTGRFLDRMALRAADLDLVVASPHPCGFAEEVARQIGAAEGCLPALMPAFDDAHTAGPIAALASAGSKRLREARTILFVTAGAGLTIGVALYQR